MELYGVLNYQMITHGPIYGESSLCNNSAFSRRLDPIESLGELIGRPLEVGAWVDEGCTCFGRMFIFFLTTLLRVSYLLVWMFVGWYIVVTEYPHISQ